MSGTCHGNSPHVSFLAGAMSPKIFGDRNFAFSYVPEIRGPCRWSAMSPKFGTVEGWIMDMSRKVIVPKTM